jgi:6-pyruvoyltetrahydropterin/6-carboxytetrahydropterin synthase
MFEVSVTQEFAAAHRLNGYQGSCSNLHGHTWKVEVCVGSDNLDENGMVIDFKDLKAVLVTILNRFDHAYINDLAPFHLINPTAENIAREIYRELTTALADYDVRQVKVWESAGSCAAYREG